MLSAMDNVAPSKTPARAIAQKQKRRASASPALGGSPAPGVVRAAAGGEVRSVHHPRAAGGGGARAAPAAREDHRRARPAGEPAGREASVTAEMQLVDDRGLALEGTPLHVRTGPPNEYSTLKDTAPVWNSEFVSEVGDDTLSRGNRLRVDLWDEAASPPEHLGWASIAAEAVGALAMREEERSLPLQTDEAARAGEGAVAASADHGQVRLRLAYVDVAKALKVVEAARAEAEQAKAALREFEGERDASEVQLQLLADAVREEEQEIAFYREGKDDGQSAAASQERIASAAKERAEARVRKAQEDSAVVIGGLRDEKKQALEAIIEMHNTTLVSFKEDLQAQATRASEEREQALAAMQAEMAMEREALEKARKEAAAAAAETAERIVEQSEAALRVEGAALHEQHANTVKALQQQVSERLARERKAMDDELESRGRVIATAVGQLKRVHAQRLSDMKASMSAAIEDYEATARQVQEAARTDVLQAAREHDAHARQLQEELLASRTEETEGERALKLQLAEAASAAAEAAAAHEEELKFANEMLNQRSKEQAAALAALEGRLAERNDELQKSLSEEVEELQTELAQQGVQLASRHKGELTELKSAYNEAIEKLKAELLAMIEERATAVETAGATTRPTQSRSSRTTRQSCSPIVRRWLSARRRARAVSRSSSLLASLSMTRRLPSCGSGRWRRSSQNSSGRRASSLRCTSSCFVRRVSRRRRRRRWAAHGG